MRTCLIVEFAEGVSSVFYLWEGPHNEGIIDRYKRSMRDQGGRVVATIRPKC